MERLTQTELAGWHVWCHKFINGRDPVEVEPAVLLSYAAWHGMMCDHEFDLKPQNSPAFLTSNAASLPVASRLELYKIAGLTELEALPLSLPAVAREARRQVEMRRVREAAGLLVDKPGPEFSDYRTPKEWRELRKAKGLAASERKWLDLRLKFPDDIHGEPGNDSKSCQITRSLAESWKLSLPEFTP